ncbi:MAG: bifunctional hydroxymethylpyrimidine kinase/phosphomethylpyrimidine kinase [Bacteroidaceae bacterium]|nr:bifunctional hydroxymethylpyrimidine kinase/phosphomethylpyrimidine kinase [Bacteroidaceae bacterium]
MAATILTITGSDGTGGSGVQADIRFISELGGVAASAVTSITVQNTLGIQEFHDLPASVVRQQVEAIVNDLQPQVVKIGLVRRIDVVETLVDVLKKYQPRHIVYAPVLKSTKGEQLVSEKVYDAIKRLLIPICTVVLEPSDLPVGSRKHGSANQLASAVAFYLSRGEEVDEAMLHARTYLKQLPADYADGNSRSEELYNQFLNAVEHFFNRYADVAFYAEQLNVSPRYLGQVTRRIAERSPKSIIDERITTEIALLLTKTNKPLKEIAQQLGFSSQAHLSRYFKKQKGVSPSQYKQSI